MPLLGTRGAASARGFGALALLGGGYWIGLLTGTSNSTAQSIATDSFGNVYIAGGDELSGYDFEVVKYNSSGVLQWQRRLGGTSQQYAYGISVDPSNNIYVCGYSDTPGHRQFQIAKYDASGVIQWQRTLGDGLQEEGKSIAADSSGNVYVCGRSDNSGQNDLQIAKYNTSGVIQWQRRLGNGTHYVEGNGVVVSPAGNVYVCGLDSNPSAYDFQLAKYNTSGVIQWQRSLDAGFKAVSITLDSSENVYACSEAGYFSKYNSAGVLQWQRRFGSSGDQLSAIASDSAGNVYICGYTAANDIVVAKYDTAGVIQWQRSLGSSSNDSGFAVSADSSGNVYLCGSSFQASKNNFIFAKLPNNGALTGTYTVGGYLFTYAASSLSDVSTSFADATSSLTDAASSLTDSASSLTDSASSLTSTVTQI